MPTITPVPTQDIVAPDAPLIVDFHYDGSGRIKSVSGSAEAYSTIHVYDGGTQLGTTAVEGSGSWTYIPVPSIAAGPHSIRARAEDASGNQSVYSNLFDLASPVRAVNGVQDAVTTHSGTASMRIEKTGLCEFRIAANAAVPVTVRAWMRKNSDYLGTAPKITLTGLGISDTGAATASLSAGADTWEPLTVTGMPNAAGVVTLNVETFSTVPDAQAWIDDITVVQE